MNVLSLFDGMSCGQIALERAGIKVDNYFASEIDSYAIQVTQKNYPNTKQLGSVLDLNGYNLPKIDLMYGGSPCQSFSAMGDGSGFDGKSKLFWEYIRILKEVKPKYFLLENVVMKKEWEDVISKELGVKPIKINSSLVSAQNRPRLYWTNIPNIQIPIDKNIKVKDIVDFNAERKCKESLKKYFNENYFKSYKSKNRTLKFFDGCAQGFFKSGFSSNRIYSIDGTCPTLTTKNETSFFELKGRLNPIECERLQNVPDNYTDCVSDTQRLRMLGNGWTVDVIAHIFKNIVNV